MKLKLIHIKSCKYMVALILFPFTQPVLKEGKKKNNLKESKNK